ncbi:hypothetical protein [Dyella amyloliquefaciens]|uniref:hypothetical protein n=1 Tax=Dyella amyloliquefaciens TaxID=1770545 RepID=UPI00102E2FC8|nr:hypothetical protein [Dyella amyloliquefaciens]
MTHLRSLKEKSSIAADTATELDIDTRPVETASRDTIAQEIGRDGFSEELYLLSQKHPEPVRNRWLPQNGFIRSSHSASAYARSPHQRAGGSRSRQAVHVTELELDAASTACVQGEIFYPLAMLIDAEEAEEAGDTSSDLILELARSTAGPARAIHRIRRQVQQLGVQRKRTVGTGQLGFAGFGWGLI